MSELISITLWIAKAFIVFGSLVVLACCIAGGIFFWKVFTHTLYLWRLAIKWNRFHSLSPEAKAEAMKNKDFSFPDDTNKTRED